MIFLLFEGLLFGIFIAIMFGSQLTAICSDEKVSYYILLDVFKIEGLFGIFTAIMFGSLLTAICSDETVSYYIL